MKRLKALWIDLGNVLVTFDHFQTCRTLAEICSLSPEEVYARLFQSGIEQGFDTGALSPEEFSKRALQKLQLPRRFDKQLYRAWCDIFTRHEENIAQLEPLSKRFHLTLVSNTNPFHFSWIENLVPELRFFHAQVLSFQAKTRKPEEAMFLRALQASGCARTEILFWDDGKEHIEAANAFGVQTALHEPGSRMQLPSDSWKLPQREESGDIPNRK